MAIKAFNSVAGFSVGNVPTNIVLGNGDITAANANFSGNGNVVGNLSTGNADLGNLAIANYFSGNANALFSIQGANVSGQVANALIAGTVYTNAQPNITSVGTLTQIDVTGNITSGNVYANSGIIGANTLQASANITGGNLISNGAANIIGNANVGGILTDNYYYANGSPVDFQQAAGSNTYIQFNSNGDFDASANFTFDSSNNLLTVVGNANLGNAVTANYFIGSGANLANITGANVTGTVANATHANSADNATTAGTVTTNAQPNITSVGNLTSLVVTGNITSGNANLGNLALANYFVGNFQGQVANGNSNINIPVANGNINLSSGGNANILVITPVGSYIQGNLSVTGNANITSNVNANNINAANNVNATGNVSGAYILGNGYYLTNISTSVISNGNSNIQVLQNSNVAISVAGNSNVLVISGTGINVNSTINSGSITANGNISANTIAVNDANVLGTTTSGSVITSIVRSPVDDITITTAAGGNHSILLRPTGNGTIDAYNARITSVGTPNNATDAVNKQYVDDFIQGLNIHDACLVATPDTLANITSGIVTYNNGANGVGANLTTTTAYTLIDNVSVANVGTRILVKSETDPAWNGIYVYSNSTVITRASDYNTIPEVEAGDFTFISAGNTYASTGWVQVSTVALIGTDPIVFTQFSGSGTYSAGSGIALTGTQFSANTDGITTGIVGGNIAVVANAQFTTPNIGAATGTSLIVTGNLTGNNLSISNLANIGTNLNVFGNIQGNNISSNGNVSGNNLSINNQANVGANLNVSGNIQGNNLSINNQANVGANLNVSGNIQGNNIRSNGNVTGNNLSISNLANVGGNLNVSGNIQGNNISSNGNVSGNNLSISNLANVGGNLNVSGNIQGNNISSNGNVTGNNLSATNNVSAGANIIGSNITSNNSIIANANITANAGLYGNTLNLTQNANILGNIVTGNITVNNRSNLGSISNISITGGNANYFIITDGQGNLSWADIANTVNISKISNGTSNVSIPVANGNINLTAGGNTTLTVTSTGADVQGNINVAKGFSVNGFYGNIGQFLTANGNNGFNWQSHFFTGNTPPAAPNYGDIWYFVDNTATPPTNVFYMWVFDGTSEYFFDFSPPNFLNT